MNISLLEKDSDINPSRNNERHYLVTPEVSPVEITQFLQLLPENQRLSFYDQFHPGTEEDPGVYVSIEKEGDYFVYMIANHGWSSKWTIQSVEFITAYILINAKSHRKDNLPFILTMSKSFRV